MNTIKCIRARRNLYFTSKQDCCAFIRILFGWTLERLLIFLPTRLSSKFNYHPFLRFLRRFFTINFNYMKKEIAILRQQRRHIRGVQEIGLVPVHSTTPINPLVRIRETPSSRLIEIRNNI